MMVMQAPPTLLCFNLRSEHVDASDPMVAAKVARAGRLLGRARLEGWRIAHAHTKAAWGVGVGSLRGLEPFVEEPVYALTRGTAFSEPALAEFARGCGEEGLAMIGALYSRSGLATLLQASELGLNVRLLSEACFAPRSEAVAPERVTAVLAPRESAAPPLETPRFSGNVICWETRRS